MSQLLAFILVCYGLTAILAWGKILDGIRPKNSFFHCPQCIGFWIGAGIASLWPLDVWRDVGLVSILFGGALSSGTSYILAMSVDDGGIRIANDSEVDASTSS